MVVLKRVIYFLSFQNISGRFGRSTVSLGSTKSGRLTASAGSVGGVSAGRRQVFTSIALHKGEVVAVKDVRKKKLTVDRALLLEMKQVILKIRALLLYSFYPSQLHYKLVKCILIA